MDKNIKVAVIGCGRISGHHCDSIIDVDGIEMIAVCDLDIAKANTYRDKFGIKAFNNFHEMLTKIPEIDVVIIATPSGMHYEHALDIIENYKKNVIIEKPTFMKPSQVNEVYLKAEEVGVNVFAVFQNRHNKAVSRVLSGIANDELGELRTLAVRVRWCRPQAYYDLAPWRGTFSMDGGSLTNQGIHHIDLMRKLGGEVERVISSLRTLGAEIEVEDTATAAIEFKNGAVGSLEITTAARPDNYEASISLVCEKGLAQIGGIAVNELQIYTPQPEACKEFSEDFSGNVYGKGHVKIYQEISDFFHKDMQFPVSKEDTLATIQLLNSFYISDEEGQWINVSDAGDSMRLGKEDNQLADLYRHYK